MVVDVGEESCGGAEAVVSAAGGEVEPVVGGFVGWCGYVGGVEGDEVEAFGGLEDGEEVAVADVDGAGEVGSVAGDVVAAVADGVGVDVGGGDGGGVSCAGEGDDAAAGADVEDGGVGLGVDGLEEEVGVFCGVVDVGVDVDGEVVVVEAGGVWCGLHGCGVVVVIFKVCRWGGIWSMVLCLWSVVFYSVEGLCVRRMDASDFLLSG